MTSPRHLVIIWDYYQHYHHARLRALRSAGKPQGWQVTGLAAGRGGAARDSHQIGSAAESIEPIYLGGDDFNLYSTRAATALAAALDRLQPDAVVVPGYGSAVGRAALRWCRRKQRGAVLIIESQEQDHPRTWWKEWIKRRLVRAADAAFVGGKSHAAYAIRLGFTPDRIYPGYSAVDNDHWWQAAEAARRNPSPASGPFFVAVGRFVAKKNFAGLVEAFARFKANPAHESWQLALVGDGPERALIEAAIRQHQVEASVRLPGYANPAETARWLAHAAALVLPSRCEEQWGLVVNEAMAAGLPVIVSTACGCTADLVIEDVTGFRVRPNDTADLANALQRMASQPDLRSIMGGNAHRTIGAFSLDRFAEQALAAADRSLTLARSR